MCGRATRERSVVRGTSKETSRFPGRPAMPPAFMTELVALTSPQPFLVTILKWRANYTSLVMRCDSRRSTVACVAAACAILANAGSFLLFRGSELQLRHKPVARSAYLRAASPATCSRRVAATARVLALCRSTLPILAPVTDSPRPQAAISRMERALPRVR